MKVTLGRPHSEETVVIGEARALEEQAALCVGRWTPFVAGDAVQTEVERARRGGSTEWRVDRHDVDAGWDDGLKAAAPSRRLTQLKSKTEGHSPEGAAAARDNRRPPSFHALL
jgi:hypothetical protein